MPRGQTQRRNAAMVALLGADLQRLNDPPRLFYVISTAADPISNPPLNLELDALLDLPANIPGNCMFLIDDHATTNWWLVVPETVTGEWLYTAFTIAA